MSEAERIAHQIHYLAKCVSMDESATRQLAKYVRDNADALLRDVRRMAAAAKEGR